MFRCCWVSVFVGLWVKDTFSALALALHCIITVYYTLSRSMEVGKRQHGGMKIWFYMYWLAVGLLGVALFGLIPVART